MSDEPEMMREQAAAEALKLWNRTSVPELEQQLAISQGLLDAMSAYIVERRRNGQIDCCPDSLESGETGGDISQGMIKE